jgi:hypothetical protein
MNKVSEVISMNMVWPVKPIQLGRGIAEARKKFDVLMESGELFLLRYTADDDKSGYIYFSAFDKKNESMETILQRFGLDDFVPYVRKGELLVMW